MAEPTEQKQMEPDGIVDDSLAQAKQEMVQCRSVLAGSTSLRTQASMRVVNSLPPPTGERVASAETPAGNSLLRVQSVPAA